MHMAIVVSTDLTNFDTKKEENEIKELANRIKIINVNDDVSVAVGYINIYEST